MTMKPALPPYDGRGKTEVVSEVVQSNIDLAHAEARIREWAKRKNNISGSVKARALAHCNKDSVAAAIRFNGR